MNKYLRCALVAVAASVVATPLVAGPFTGKNEWCVGRYAGSYPTLGVGVTAFVFQSQSDENGRMLSLRRMPGLGRYNDAVATLLKGIAPSYEALISPPQLPALGAGSGELTVRVLGTSNNMIIYTFTLGSNKVRVLGGMGGNYTFFGTLACARSLEEAIGDFRTDLK